jgi:stress-induced morphogen
MDANQIQQSIELQMPDAKVQVSSPDGVHFTAEIESHAFAGLSRIAQHRMVHEIIGPALGAEIHALSLHTRAPSAGAADRS